MDVDLSTDLDALLPLVAPLLTGHSDVAIGTRLARSSQVERGPKREFISRTYNRMLRVFMGVGFSDAQCGFKAVRTDRVRELLPLVEDDEWFFDTELLLIAERAACASTKSQWTGPTTRTHGWTSSTPRGRTCAAWPGWVVAC